MSIAKLSKVTICGLSGDKSHLLQDLQALGCMHLLPLRPAPREVEEIASPRAEAAYKALQFLTPIPLKRRQVLRDPTFDVDKLVKEALELKQQLRETTDRRDFLGHRIAEVEPWGDILFPPEESLAGYHFWFYILPLNELKSLKKIDLPWQIVRRDNRFAYVVVISTDEPASDLLPVPRTHTGKLPISELKAKLEDTEVEIEELRARRVALTRYIYLLSVNIAEAENRASLAFANQQTRDEEGVVAIQGWVPNDAIPDVANLVKELGLACLIEKPGPGDNPPTLLEDSPKLDAGKDLALFYQIPSYMSWDPSLILLFSFSLFFAMILSDAGYAAVLMMTLAIFWKRLGHSEKARSYRLTGIFLFSTSIVWGIMVGSYFGLSPSKGSWLATLHVLRLDDFDTMMTISIFVGVVHLTLANGINAWVNRGRLVALSSIGWIAALIGGVTLWRAGTHDVARQAGTLFLCVGLLLSFLFSSERVVTRPADYLWRGLDGFKALTGALSMFGDVLSYMRLFALGLAAASLALTFNNLASELATAVPGLGLLLAILILLIGHILNIVLSIMSGVVHGLRLNYIEFFKWGLPSEGTVFRKFARKEVQP